MLKAHSAVQSMRSGRTRGRVHITPKTAEKNFLKLFTSSSSMRGWYRFKKIKKRGLDTALCLVATKLLDELFGNQAAE